MNNRLLHKRMPTALGLVLIVLSILVTSSLVRGNLSGIIKAASQAKPENVVISNVSATTFTVSYTTQDTVLGSLRYSTGTSYDQTVFDDRDQKDNTPRPHSVHHITVQKLSAKTTYHFQIVSGGDTYADSSFPSSVTTAQINTGQENTVTVSGQIGKTDASAFEALVYVSADKSQIFSGLAKSDGSYTIAITSPLSQDFSSPIATTDTTPLLITVQTNTAKANATVLVANASQVPLIILAQSYDFTSPGFSALTDTTSSESAGPFPTYAGQVQKATNTPRIISPEQDSTLSDPQPLFKGTAAPNQTVTITIHSDPIQATVTTDANGNWTYRPTTKLSPGTHTITILTKDALGALKKVEESFVVNAQGSQFTEPSVSPIQPTGTPTTAPTATTAPSQPTETGAQASPTPTAVFFSSPTPTAFVKGDTGPTKPPTPLDNFQTGNSPIFYGIIASVATVIIGSILFFLTRGSMSV